MFKVDSNAGKIRNNAKPLIIPFYSNSKVSGIKIIICAVVLCLYTGLITSCTSDKELKADIATKAKTDLNFINVAYFVEGKVVTLQGTCPTEKSKQGVEQTIKSINLVKSINNQIQVAPVVLDDDMILKQGVDSVLSTYPTVAATVKTGNVTLLGKIPKAELAKFMPAINKLKPAQVINQLQVE